MVDHSITSAADVSSDYGRGLGVLAARLRHDADVWPGCLEALRPDRLGFVVTYGACDNHVFALYPVCGGSHAV
jgi:hypothetical protein